MKRRLTCEPLVRRVILLYVVPSLLSVLIAFGSGASGVDSGRDCRIVEWSGAADSAAPNWSDPDNWVGGARPGACDVAKLGPAALDSVVDSEFDGEIAGLILDRAYAGTLRLRRGLTIAGDLSVAGGRLELGVSGLVAERAFLAGGEIDGGRASLRVDGAFVVTGGEIATPAGLMRVERLEIHAPGVVRMGHGGKLEMAAANDPLVGDGVLDTVSNRPNSVEYTGATTNDLTAAAPMLAPLGFGASSAKLQLYPSEGNLKGALVDAANGFAYFGTYTTPAFVVKVRLSDFTRVGAIALNPGEDKILSGSLDSSNGFAYFGTTTWPGIVVKIRLTDFQRDSALTLSAGEGWLTSSVIDPANGVAYFGTNTLPGRVVKVQLSDFTRVASLTFNQGEDGTRAAILDPALGYAYFGTGTSYGPGHVVRVRLSDFQRVDALALGTGGAMSAVVDTGRHLAYFGTWDSPGRVVKVDLAAFTLAGTAVLNSNEDWLTSAVIEPGGAYAFFGTNTAPGKIVKVRLSDMVRTGALNLPGAYYLFAGVLDPSGTSAYFGGGSNPGQVVKVRLSDLTILAALELRAGENLPNSAVVDVAGGFAYIGTSSMRRHIVKIRLSDFTRVGALSIDTGVITAAVLDAASGFAYFGASRFPGEVIRIRLADFSVAGSLLFPTGEDDVRAAAIDPVEGMAYFGLHTSPGRVEKVRLSDFSRVGSLLLGTGENFLWSAIIDPVNRRAYFGTATSPGKVVGVDLATFARIGAVAFNTGENSATAAAFDPSSGHGYFAAPGASSSDPGSVVQVRLADLTRVAALRTWIQEESSINSLLLDEGTGRLYLGVTGYNYRSPRVVKVKVPELIRAGHTEVGFSGESLLCAFGDPGSGFGYFATYSEPTTVHRIDLGNTTTSVTASTNPVSLGDQVTLTATVSSVSPGGGVPAGTVTFRDGGTGIPGCIAIVLDAAGTAPCATSSLAVGAHAIDVSFVGNDAGFNPSSGALAGGLAVTLPQVVTVDAPSPVCSGSASNSASVPDAGPAAIYAWTISNGEITSGQGTRQIGFTAGSAGETALGVTVTVDAASSSGAKAVLLDPLPSASITAPLAACANAVDQAASVPEAGAGATYTWTIVNGVITSGAGTPNVLFTAGSAGSAGLSVTVTSGAGCTASGSASITVNPLPDVTIGAPAAVCAGAPGNAASMPDAGAGATYAWTIANGTISSGAGTRAITFTAGLSGTTTLGVTITTAAGCVTSSSKPAAINPIPSASVTAPASLCAGGAGFASVADAGAGATYSWSAINGTITSGGGTRSITFAAGSSGTSTVSVVVTTAGGCSASGSASVGVSSAPSALITAPASTCASSPGKTASVPDAGVGATYNWSLAGGTITAGTGTRAITWTAGTGPSTSLSVTVVTAAGCTSTGSASVTLVALPYATITAASSVRKGSTGNTASVPSAGAGATYTWSISNGTITSGAGTASIRYKAGSRGTLTLNVTVRNASGCASSGTKSVTVTN